MVVNYAASAGPAQEVADAIVASGGEAIVVGADMSKKEDIDRCVLPYEFSIDVNGSTRVVIVSHVRI